MNREYWIGEGEDREPNIEAMLAKLLDDDILFANERNYICPISAALTPENQVREATIVLFVRCNDVFAWGCADAEPLTTEDVPNLFEECEKDPKFGMEKWVCKKRNEKPQKPYADMIKEKGCWNDEMESLPENQYDKACEERLNKQEESND